MSCFISLRGFPCAQDIDLATPRACPQVKAFVDSVKICGGCKKIEATVIRTSYPQGSEFSFFDFFRKQDSFQYTIERLSKLDLQEVMRCAVQSTKHEQFMKCTDAFKDRISVSKSQDFYLLDSMIFGR